MGEQHRLVESRAVAVDAAFERRSRQGGKDGLLCLVEGEGHKCGPGFGDAMTKLRRDLIGKPRGPHLGDGFAACGHDEVLRLDGDGMARAGHADVETRPVMRDIIDRCFQPEGRPRHFGAQHGDDVLGRAVAK